MKEVDKSENLWLLQTYDNGDFHIYGWTPALAKKNLRPITDEQANHLMQLIRSKRNNVKYVDDPGDLFMTQEELSKLIKVKPRADMEDDIEDDDENTRELIKSVVKTDKVDEPKNLDEVRDINISQEDIMAAELKAIQAFKHKSSLEKHMLEKYQLEIPPGRFSVMKALANKMITDLAKENRLYMVDGLIEA